MDETTVRDVVKDAIRDVLGNSKSLGEGQVDAELVGSIADAVFEVLAIDEEDQDQPRESGCLIWLISDAKKM